MDQPLSLKVTGMSCGGCESAIRRALSTLDGVTDVTASHRDSSVTLRFEPEKIDPAKIAEHIELLGYEVGR
jgi:copper chaperone